ncbi:MAG TPA: DUF2891 family protein [Actinomycetota bacterium]|nr:DUF2891 family protein [Actinomycetota bacterium]
MRRPQRALLGMFLVLATIAASFMPAASAGAAPKRSTWAAFLEDRVKLYEELAPAFVSCFKRRDSLIDPLSPIFHGCLDWHSAVHAAYSHHVLYRRTGDETYLDLVHDQFAPAGVSLVPAEEVYERAKGADLPLTENPYGFGWFLILARERETSTDEKDLRSMADYAASQMGSWFETRAARGDAQRFILNTAHPNYSWSLINLDIWARYTKDKELLAATRKASEPLLDESLDGLCPVKNDTNPKATGFQPACLMRLAAVFQVRGAAATSWVAERLPKKALYIPPITEPSNCHAGGLNFTRAFALYQLYRSTGNTAYRDNYAELIRYHVGRPDLYIDESYLGDPGYMCYSHWVAQVGVRAISLSYGD